MTEATRPLRPETIAAAHGVASDAVFGAVAPPLYLSSTYEFAGFEKPRAYDYGRAGNPTREMLAQALAKLEGGAGAVVTASGMAALDLIVSQLPAGARVVAPHDCYGGTMRLLKARESLGQLSLRLVDQGSDAAVAAVLAEKGTESPALLLVETPSNPLLRVVDIAALAARARDAGAAVAVDNTFLSPALQRPIMLGADYVIHSTTKYLNGHSDVIGGAVIAADTEAAAGLARWANIVGCSGSPFDAWATLRGLRTLFPRMRQQTSSAMAIALRLSNHPAVSAVHYPGLETHADHALAARQQSGFGAMLSFELVGGVEAVERLVSALRLFTFAESLGGVESLIVHPATMTHADMGEEARSVAGIGPGLLRLSVGLEAEEDLLADLVAGLAVC